MQVSTKVAAQENDTSKTLVAIKAISKNEEILKFTGHIVESPTKYTLQISRNKHLESDNTSNDFLNHSCNPNTYICFEGLNLRALRDISPGERLTFNYLTTEWDMANKFICSCKEKNCFGFIAGFKYLTTEQRKPLIPILSPYLKSKLEQ